MSDDSFSLYQLVAEDKRYPVEAYMFVREALAYATDSMALGHQFDAELEFEEVAQQTRRERHLTGQQLCEAIREYATKQFGYMARIVLKNWGIENTGCFGDIVYNMIDIGIMKKSSRDRRSHFDNVFRFDDVFESQFEICHSMSQRRS